MRVLFFGTSTFAVPTLRALHAAALRHQILGVVTQPDRPSGRGLKLQLSPVKEEALAAGYMVHQPEKVRRKAFVQFVTDLAPDALVVVSFGQIIPQAMLDIPRYGGINVHGSLLPRWRGAAPIHHAILAGDRETGVATMQMEASLDTGPVYLEAREPIGDEDTTGTLEPRLAALGAPLLVETLDRLEAGDITPTPQPEEGMTYASPAEREMGLLDPATETAVQLSRRVRATHPRPGSLLTVAGKVLKVHEVRALPENVEDAAPGTVQAVRKDGIKIATVDGSVFLLMRIQPENKAAMSAADWARGTRIQPGDPASRPLS